jgi:Xaa-Pro dipeptidase
MSDLRAQRVAAAGREVGADWVILTSYDAVAYGAGHVAGIETGPTPFTGGPTLAVVAADGSVAVLCNELERGAADAGWAERVETYESLGYGDLTPLEDKHEQAARRLFAEIGVAGTVAVQAATFTAQLARAVPETSTTVAVDRALERARAVKTADEIAALRRCAEVTAVGHSTALRVSKAGRSELEAFADIRCAMESAAGERLPVTGDFLSGIPRTAGVMGWPGTRTIEDGDPVICDLAPRVAGYWGDSCNSFVVGEPSPRYAHLWQVSQRALEHAVERLRPGITAGQLDAAVRGVVTGEGLSNPLHIGHGIGTSSHEWPRLVPGHSAGLQEDMVLMVEPGAYDPEIGGVRLEWMLRVTADGCEVLSPFAHSLGLAMPGG